MMLDIREYLNLKLDINRIVAVATTPLPPVPTEDRINVVILDVMPSIKDLFDPGK